MQTINEEIFRAYDIRGTYPTTINEQVAFTIGKSYGSYLQEKYIIQIFRCQEENENDLQINFEQAHPS